MQMQSMQKLNIERLKALAEAEPDISVVSYTHLTLPTKRRGEVSSDGASYAK